MSIRKKTLVGGLLRIVACGELTAATMANGVQHALAARRTDANPPDRSEATHCSFSLPDCTSK